MSARKPAHKRAGVAGGDGHDVRRQPEVRVEHGAHHLHGVAVDGKILCDDERDEAHARRSHRTDSVTVDFFPG